MCRSLADGGRRCPCGRGDRRRAAARLRYAARIAATSSSTDTPTEPGQAPTATPSDALAALHERRHRTAAAADTALAALRADRRTETEAAYADAVITHGEVLRDIAEHHIDAELTRRGLDDNSVAAEAFDIQQRYQHLSDQLTNARTAIVQAINDGTMTNDESTAAASKAAADYSLGHHRITQASYDRADEIEKQRAEISKAAYYEILSTERTFGNTEFIPSNTDKMTRKDRAMFKDCTALYPDEMVEHAVNLGDMLAKRSKARAHYGGGVRQTKRRKLVEVLSLEYAMTDNRLNYVNAYYVENPGEVAAGRGDNTWRHAMTVPRTPENEARIAMMVQEFNTRSSKPAVMHFATAATTDGGTEEVIYVQGHRTRIRTVSAGYSAELTYSDSRSMTHELGHRMEDNNREISIVTKAFLARRTAGLPQTRYGRTELVVEDGFSSAYIGKNYEGTDHTELVSCGMEAITHGRYGGLRGHPSINMAAPQKQTAPRADREHLAMVLGLLAVANKRLESQ
ncbi:hypothetical protein [Mycolicibacterium llatzerense]|uniref:hypothetical protein n=1 Tax=Mycolicibacterium llatzerense TaxID=280871 RepID=UPI0021B623FE|nr:hypothetical protein [Mycolicibacterium llatzerense]MCT7371957.1 hypothetical protein [Mycolicibacterium llatzerense]